MTSLAKRAAHLKGYTAEHHHTRGLLLFGKWPTIRDNLKQNEV